VGGDEAGLRQHAVTPATYDFIRPGVLAETAART
jgi:hypothetical protein